MKMLKDKARPRFVLLREENESQHIPHSWRERRWLSMFYQYLLLHYAAKMYEGKRTARTEVPCYYWACALTLWQRVYFYLPIGGWFWNNPRNRTLHYAYSCVLSTILNLRLSAYTALSVRVFDTALRRMKTEISITHFQDSNGSLFHDKSLVSGLSPERSKFDPGSVHMRFTVDNEAVKHGFLDCRFPLSVLLHICSTPTSS